jgi:protein TonB
VAAPPVRTAPIINAAASCQKPEYPSASRRNEEEGTVQLRFLIGPEGNVLESQVEKSSGFTRLDEAARSALSRCQFKPGTLNGKPEQSWASMKYTWRLE